MLKKILATLTGSVSLFGVSAANHLDILSPSLNSKNSLPRGALNSFSFPYKSSINRKANHSKSWNSLSWGHFGDWSNQSEGAKNSIYLVTKDGLAKEIAAKVHGQKRRYLRGKIIDEANTWFGPRSVPFSKNDSSPGEEKKKTLVEQWSHIKNSFLNLDYAELSKLSKWFHDLDEKIKCEIVDVLVDCDKFKEVIGASKWGKIKTYLKIDFQKLSELASKEWNNQLPKFGDVIGWKGFLYIGRLYGFESRFGKMLDIWVQEEVDKELKKLSKDSPQKKNGVELVRKLLSAELYGEGCEKYSENPDEKIVYAECFTKPEKNLEEHSGVRGERYFFPKVVDVIKAGKWWNSPVYAPSKYLPPSVGETKQKENYEPHQWKEYPIKIRNTAHQQFLKVDGWKGAVDSGCATIKSTDATSGFLSFLAGGPLEQKGCVEFYNLLFSGDVKDKRWCLFELPETKSFVKETHLFGPFVFSNWNKGSRFWTKCSNYEI